MGGWAAKIFLMKEQRSHRAERASNLTFSKCLHLVDLNNPLFLMTHDEMTVLIREDLAHSAKTGVNELTDVFMGGKVYGLE